MLNWPQDQTLQHLIGGLQDSLKPYVIMANPETLEDTCDIILRAHNANKAHSVNQGLTGIQSALSEILTQVKKEGEKKTVAAVYKPQEQPQEDPQPPPRRNDRPPQGQGQRRPNQPRQQPRQQPTVVIHATQPQPQYERRTARRFTSNSPHQPAYGTYNPSARNPCFNCGASDHWKRMCPHITGHMVPYQRLQPRSYWVRRGGPSGPARQPRRNDHDNRRQENY